tara:strand:- start:1782 stop:2009 length:228 start_codon:yes stop_codon:yes gene_type:complete
MPRKNGCNQTKNAYSCKVTINNNVLMPLTEFKTLRDIATELGMTYSQIADINSGRVIKKYSFKFMPDIHIEKIVA